MRILVFAALAQAMIAMSGASAQTAPAGNTAPDLRGMSGDAAERFLDRQTNYRKLDEDVAGSTRSLRPVPARPKDVLQGLDVRDSKGLVVGTIAKVDGGFAVVASPLGKVEVDVASFAKNRDGLLINLPKTKIDAMMTGGKPVP